MTCIVGLVANGTVYIGGDSASVSGWQLTVRADDKVFSNGPMLFGFTSSWRMGQLLRYALKVPERDPNMAVEEYMVTTFVNAVRDCLKAGGYAREVNKEESAGCFLVGYEGMLWSIYADYQVGRSVEPYDAVGCGEDIAKGAFFGSEGAEPKDRVLLALMAAERFSAGVRAPFVVGELSHEQS